MLPSLVLATTVARFSMQHPERYLSWLSSPVPTNAHAVTFAAIEIDGLGAAPFAPLVGDPRLNQHWTFSLNDGRTKVDMVNRSRHIAMGQALGMEFAQDRGADWFAFLSADCALPRGWFEKLLEGYERYGHTALGVRIPALHDGQPSYPYVPQLRVPLETRAHHGGFFMLHRDLYFHFRARSAPGYGADEYTLNESLKQLGAQMVYRTDVIARHYPEHVTPYEQRYDGKDLEVRW